MFKSSYFSQYESPNIVIVPTVSFCNPNPNKKRKLETDCHVGGTSKNWRNSEGQRGSVSQINRGLVENITPKDNKNTISPNSSNISLKRTEIKLNRLKNRSEPQERVLKAVESKHKQSLCETSNSQANLTNKIDKKNGSESTISTDKALGLKTIMKNSEKTNSKAEHFVCNINNSNSTLREFKTQNPGDISKYRIPKKVTTNKSKYCDKKTDSKAINNITEPTEEVVIDNQEKFSQFKLLENKDEKVQQIKSNNNGNCLKAESKNINHNKIISKIEINNKPICDVRDQERGFKEHNSNEHKHKTQIMSKNKENKDISSSKSKHLSCNKRDTDEKKSKLHTKTCKTKNTGLKSSSNDKDKKKKTHSKNKSQSNNKIYKLKVSTISSKKSSQEKIHTNDLIPTPKKVSTKFENITAPDETQSDNLKNLRSPNANKFSKSLKKDGIKIIINLVIKNAENQHEIKPVTPIKSCLKTDDNKTKLITNSELSFLDDINIDEIVDIISQPNQEKEVIQRESQDTQKSIVETNAGIIEENIICDENVVPNTSTAPVEFKKCDISGDVTPICNNINKAIRRSGSENNNAQFPDVTYPTSVESNYHNQEVIEENNKNWSIDITDDDKVDALSDCSTVILDRSDVYEFGDTLDKITIPFDLESTIYNSISDQKDSNIECLANQTEKILSEKAEMIVPRDPIEAQLSKLFEMSDSMTDVETIINIDDTTDVNNTSIENPEVREYSNNNEKQNVTHASDESLNSCNNNKKIPQKEIRNTLNSSVEISTKGKVQKPLIDTRVVTTVKTVKSEVKKVTKNKTESLTLYSSFIKDLEARMSRFLKKKYTVTVIHNGKYSKIYKCTDSGGSNYALKMMKTRCRYTEIQQETMLMDIQRDIPKENLHSVYFMNGFSIFGDWCFLMEYYPKTLLRAMRENDKSFHIDNVQELSKQLVIAVTVLRNNNIVHADIKPGHILINNRNDRIKLCGFDNAYYIHDSPLSPNIGSINYRAPEIILGHSFGFSLDVWSTALIMYEMATNSKLFPGCQNNDILYKQQCTLGPLPCDMIDKSLFKENHFYGNRFMRRIGFNKEIIRFVTTFKRSTRIHRTLFDTYAHTWSEGRTESQRMKDLLKLANFQILLEKMLAIHPKHRLPIEFVYANPFIYEYSDMTYT